MAAIWAAGVWPVPELVWNGKYDADGQRHHPDPATLAGPLTLHETFGAAPHRNRLVEGDAAAVAAALLPEFGGCVDLIYFDPPFAVGSRFHTTAGVLAYADTWPDLDAYLAFMDTRLQLALRLLAPTGSLWLHCDHRAGPHLALLCDELLGRGDRDAAGRPGFRNEVIWHYGLGGSSARCFPKKHDLLLWYTPGEAWQFVPPLTAARSQKLKGQQKKQPDVWDLPTLNNQAYERTGYPTQKPQVLLERIIAATSRPGDLVLDLFCGSGTTLAAADRLGRRWLGCDSGTPAVLTARRRLAAAGASLGVWRSHEPAAWAEPPLLLRLRATPTGRCARLLGDLAALDSWAVGPAPQPHEPFAATWLGATTRRVPELPTESAELPGEPPWAVNLVAHDGRERLVLLEP